MSFSNILFDSDDIAIAPSVVKDKIINFDYTDASYKTIVDSQKLDREVFIECTTRILSNFGMTRGGPFKDIHQTEILPKCWKAIGDQVLEIHNSVVESGHFRDRYLLEISASEREELSAKIWSITKLLLPLTMGKTS